MLLPPQQPQQQACIPFPYLRIHYSFLLEAGAKHVHGVDLTPKVTVVLGIVASRQVAKCGRHVRTFRWATQGKVSSRTWKKNHPHSLPLPTLWGPTSPITWCGRNAQDLVTQPGIFLCRVCFGLCVQCLVNLGQDNLPQVEETCAEGKKAYGLQQRWGRGGAGRTGYYSNGRIAVKAHHLPVRCEAGFSTPFG